MEPVVRIQCATVFHMGARSVIFCILILVAGAPGVVGQSTEDLLDDHRYSEAIEKLREGGTSGPAASALGQAHLRRGYALRDLARLQAEVGAAYYTKRDTSAAARSGALTTYYATRYRLASSAEKADASALRRVSRMKDLPSPFPSRAQVWVGLAQHRKENGTAARETWSRASSASNPSVAADRALAHWRAGEPLPALDCEAAGGENVAALRCRLWAAVRAEDWTQVAVLQMKLIDAEHPADETRTFRTEGGDPYEVSFYDPGTLWALAVADFRAAAAAYRTATEGRASLLAGLAALEGRDYDAARVSLEAAGQNAYRSVYRAVLGAETGSPSPVEALWAEGGDHRSARVRAVWAQEASTYAPQQEAVRTYCENQNPPKENMQLALRLGRGALNVGQPETATRLLQRSYPVSRSNDVREIDPAYLATFAWAKFAVGPRYESDVLRHLNALSGEYPIAAAAYDLAQGFYVPERTEGRVR